MIKLTISLWYPKPLLKATVTHKTLAQVIKHNHNQTDGHDTHYHRLLAYLGAQNTVKSRRRALVTVRHDSANIGRRRGAARAHQHAGRTWEPATCDQQ